jgi:hypothetical protein
MGRWLAMLGLVGIALGAWVLRGVERRPGASAAVRGENAAASAPGAPTEVAVPARMEASMEAPAARVPLVADTHDVTRDARAAPGADALVVEVVDPLGAPRAGIPLRLEPREPSAHAAHVPDGQRSDARGRAVFAGVRERLASGEPWVLRADLAFEEPPSLELAAALLAASIVRFELPPGAPLDVLVHELDGSSAPAGSTLRLQLVRPEERSEPDLTGPEWKPAVEGGAAHFPWVELHRDWELSAWRPRGAEPTRLRARGPARSGERVTLELVLGSDHPVVSYRVLRSDGAPLVATEVELARSLFGSRATASVTTDSAGRFTLDARSMFLESGDFTVTWRPPDGAPQMARGSLPPDPKDGWNDGGDLLLSPEPLLCAGRVVDARGAAVAGAEVIAGQDHGWLGSTTVRDRSDADGRFELRGLWIARTFPVHAVAAGARSDALEARQGADDLELVLAPRFTLSGELLLDPGVDPGAIRFALEGPGGEREDVARRGSGFVHVSALHELTGRTSDPARFELEPIAGGLRDVLFLLEGAELARLAGVAVRSDLDLGPIDLRGRIALCEIELVGSGDLSGLTGELAWTASDGDGRGHGSIHGALVRILSPQAPIDVELRPRGHRMALLERVSGRCRHVLEAPLRVRLVLQTTGVLPPPPYRFDAEPYLGDSAVGAPDGPRWFTPERRAIEWLVSTPGRLTARWHLEKRVEGDGFGGAIGTHVLRDRWITFDVLDTPGVQEFVLELDAEALEGITAELDG